MAALLRFSAENMASEELVLVKPRSQQLIEMIALPLIMVPTGPLLRAGMGARYSPLYGLITMMLLILLSSRVTSLWAARHGGEWVTKAERLLRTQQQAASISRVWTCMATVLMVELILLGGMLIIGRLDEASTYLGGKGWLASYFAALGALSGASALFSRRRLVESEINEGAPPRPVNWPGLRRLLPRIYIAFAIGAAAGVAVARSLSIEEWGPAYTVTCLGGGMTLSWVLLRREIPQQLYSGANLTLGLAVLCGLMCFGIPMWIMFTGMVFAEAHASLMHMAVQAAIFAVSIPITGVGFGALMYFVQRLTNVRRRQLER